MVIELGYAFANRSSLKDKRENKYSYMYFSIKGVWDC